MEDKLPTVCGGAAVSADAQLRHIMAITPDGIMTTDLKGTITSASAAAAALFGYPPEDLVGSPASALYPGGHAAASRLMKALVQKDCITDSHLELLKKDGSLLEVALWGVLIRDENGTPCGTLGIFRDVSELKRLSRQVFQAERMASVATLAGGIAHNFNNLLMSIQGYTSLMMLDVSEKHRHFDMLQKIENQIATGSRLTQKLMGFAREGEYSVKLVDLHLLIADVLDGFQGAQEHIRVQTDLGAETPAVVADRAQIEEAFQNLLLNAADAMPGGGKITCRTRLIHHTAADDRDYSVRPGCYVQVTVADTGHGISAKDLPHIFEPFYSTKELHKGAGLGLASVFGIVKAHGGYVDVTSTPGEGAIFELLLPAQAATVETEAPSRNPVDQGKATILVVDDDEMVLEVAVKMLEALGYQTHAAATAAEAFSVFSKHADTIDLVLLDLSLDGVDGADVFHGIRERNGAVQVLIASGRSLDEEARALMDAGAGGFIQKPFGVRDLSTAIQKVLGEP